MPRRRLTVADVAQPSFNPAWDRFHTWRGPSWVNTAWVLVAALRELGYDEAAVLVDLVCQPMAPGTRSGDEGPRAHA